MENVNVLFSQLDICPDSRSSRAGAKKAKERKVNFETCICCYRAFDTRSQILKHFKTVHKADKEAIKKQYWADKVTLEQNPESPAALQNYNLSVAKLAFLIKYKLHK